MVSYLINMKAIPQTCPQTHSSAMQNSRKKAHENHERAPFVWPLLHPQALAITMHYRHRQGPPSMLEASTRRLCKLKARAKPSIMVLF